MKFRNLYKLLDSHKWILFVTRPIDILTVIPNARADSEDLKQFLGFGLNLQAFLSTKGVVEYYRDKKDLLSFKKKLHKLIIKNPEKILKILKSASKLNKTLDNEIKILSKKNIYKDKNLSDLRAIFKENFLLFQRHFIPCVVVPYFVGLVEEEFGLKSNRKKIQQIKQISKKIRSISYYLNYREIVIGKLLETIAKKRGCKKSDLDYLTPEEIISFSLGKFKLPKNIKAKRRIYFYLRLPKREFIVFSKTAIHRLKKLLKKPIFKKKLNIIEGNTSFMGKVRGETKIVFSKRDFKKFKKSDILVTPSTNPHLLPIIKMCSAIVADEGGLTSHAAIISRELKKPCVIGAKIATKVLKDGDRVEVDANKGIVKILKKD